MGQQPVLNTLHIKNYAIIKELTLELKPGLTVFTGETGAGKSIIVDALGLALGARSNSRQKTSREPCQVTAHFTPTAETTLWLRQKDLPPEEGVLIRRMITPNGNKAYLNDQQITLQTVKTLAPRLAAIQGQHAHQSLHTKEQQQKLLDQYGKIDTTDINTAYRQWTDIKTKIEQIQSQTTQHSQQELLTYQTEELGEINPTEGEYEALDAEHKQLANSEHIQQICHQVNEVLNGENSITEQGNQAAKDIQQLTRYLPDMKNTAEQITAALITLQEAATDIKKQATRITQDPQRLQQTETRLQVLHTAARKHNIQPRDLPAKLNELQTQLHAVSHREEELNKLNEQLQQAKKQYTKTDTKLSTQRKKAAATLQQEITRQLQTLGMPKSKVTIAITNEQTPRANGTDDIEFIATINPGLPPQPIRKTASGGELSRICLAIHSATPQTNATTNTMIFDEVDAGTGGAAAAYIGEKLKQLATTRQVFCITHQPQIAVNATTHYKITKQTTATATTITATELPHAAREEEIARMLAGTEITRQTRAHAKEMLTTATDTAKELI